MRGEDLRRPALIAVPIGAVGSVGLMLSAAHRNGTRMLFLLVLFTGWVLSPFVALAWAHAVSKRWSPPTRSALHVVTLVIAIASLLIYAAVAFGPPREKIAPVFVMVPPASWLLLAITVPIAARLAGRKSQDSHPRS
jgi:hypothetical protein